LNIIHISIDRIKESAINLSSDEDENKENMRESLGNMPDRKKNYLDQQVVNDEK
jgi:hypothetical protein